MGCVNIKSREFRNLATKNNIDSNTLELITHKYWIEKGSEELFPTDFYIQAQLGNTQYKEPGKSVRELWKTNYSTPKEFSSMEELQVAQQEALKFFSSSALVHYKNAEGKYVLNVKQPVARVNSSVSEFSENGITRNKIDLGINPKETYTIDKVQELFNKFNTDRRSKKLAERVFSIAKDLGLKITFDESLPLKSLGRYTDNNTIIYKKSFLERDLMNDIKAPVLLHEVIHALTMYTLSDKTKGLGKTKEIENFNKEIDSIYQDVKNNKALKGELGTKDLKEFVAELSNPIFRKKLQSIDRKNIWQRILDAFRRLFGIKTDSTYYKRAITALDNALSAFDLDLYLRYNGARDLLQKGYKAEEWKFREMPISEVKETIKQYYLNTLPLNLELSEGTKQRLKAAQAAAKIARDNFTYAQENDDTGEAQDKAINSRVDAFNQQYGDLIKTITPFSNTYGGKSFSVKFKTPRELINQQNAPVLEQLNLIDTMSDDDLLSTLALIEQEYADYELINGEEEKPTGKSEHSGPQPFTFNDGITVNAPFKPNKQQAEALNIMSDFINSDETTMTLSGYAGTGKTSLMEMIAQKMRKERKRIIFSATTNKAAAVLKSKVGRAGFDAYTLNKVFGISVEVDSSQAYNARNLVNKIKESDIVFPGNIVVIDEASMINEENYRILNQIAEENNLKVIYVGDEAQLAPVNERQISKVFRNNEGRIARLTQVERTDDNAILKEATDIRNGKPLSGISSFNDKGEGVAYIPPTNRKGIGDIVRHFVQGLKDNPNYFRILAYTNAAISRYNEAVRRTLGYTGHIPEKGEPMTGYNNWGYDRDTKSYRFINSESYKVVDVGKPIKATIRVDNKNISMESVPITLEDSFGNRDTFNLMDIKGNQENLKIAQRLAQEKVRLWEQFRKAPRELKGEIINRINRIEQFLFVNDNIYDPTRKDKNGNPIVLQNKVIDFGYALTIHKSQGSTFTHVLMDDADVSKASGAVNSMQNAIPVGLEADARDFTNTEVKSTEEVDLGDLSNVEETSVQTSQIANVRQQLRYVGVSRATDTVTIISDNVKKEDSPLNHLSKNEEGTDNNRQQAQQQSTPASYEGMITPEPNTIFVFGSNPEGRHGDGAAKTAKDKFGAIYGQGEGLQGNSYALPTKDFRVKENKSLRSISPEQITENIRKMYEVARQNPDKQFKVAYTNGLNEATRNGYTGAEMIQMFKDAGPIPSNVIFSKNWTDRWNEVRENQQQSLDNSNNNDNFVESNKKKVEYGDDFRRIQETVRRDSQRASVVRRDIGEDARQRLARITKLELNSNTSPQRNSQWTGISNKGTRYNIIGEIPAQLFHDIFEVVRYYTVNGELVDLHDDYSNCKCYLSDDGTCGFAIEPNGNLISVFNLGLNRGFLSAIKDIAISQGATHLDAFDSDIQPLRKIYEHALGAKVASSMDYNMEYDHDDIAKNHGNPQVVFMVIGEAANKEIEERHFNKDQYDEAEAYQQSMLQLPQKEQRISLPNYEYFSDLHEGTLVNAEWKIPLLQRLDARISERMEAEDYQAGEEAELLREMDRILNAESEEELNRPIHEEKKEVKQNLNEYEKLTQQINNLLDSEVITASEIRHTAELVINSISDTISDIQKGLLNPEIEFPGFSSNLDMKTATRKEIVEAIGINRLIDRAKEKFDPENNTAIEDLSALEQADLIVDNWDAIMTLAADVFAANEGFGIQRDYDKGNFKTSETFNVDWDNFNQSQDTETTEEIEGDEQEHWQIESRTLDILNSMSQLVRLGLHDCYLLDKDGNKVMSKWGIAERVNPRNAVNSILRWTKGALSLEDMVKKLHDKQAQNPWVNQLIERLSNQNGKETDFQSQFFGVFSKHFQPYSIVLLEDGKYSSIPVNNHPALTEAMTSITSQYKIGQHPLFTDRGINEKLLGSENTTSSDAEFNLHKALRNLQTIVDSLNHNEELTTEQAKEATSNILGASRLMGYNVSEELIDNIMNDENIKKMTSSLFFMVKSLDSALAQQKRNAGNPNAGTYNPFAFGTDNNIGGTLRNFLTPITDQLEDTAINAFYDSGKMYQSYVTPSFLTKLMNKFRLEGQEFEDFMMSEYGNSEWFKTAGTDFNAGWRNEWLRLLARDENARKAFDHKVELNFNKHNYMRNMSDAEYTLSLITEYFAEAGQKGQTMVPAWFRVPMQSNKPSSEFIKFLSYRGAEYKNQIVDGLHKMFAQELSRIQTTRMRNHSKNDAEFIKNFDSNGRKFNFLPFLNKYLEANETSHLGLLLKKKIDGLEALSAEEEAALASMVDKVIYDHMENRVQEILNKWENNGILEAAKNIKDIGEDEATIRANVENFLWNDNFAAKNILQLTITDIAFYKDAEDLQKRLAQLHAPGIRGNKNATDYEGHKVSDGYYRTFILKDFDTFRANIIANINEVFDRKINRAPESQKEALRALKDSLTRPPKTNGENDKGGKYWNINVADAQGYSSPSSYRKKAFIFGKWSKKAEDVYNKLLKGDYKFDDLETAFQPLKPFVYSHLQKNMGVEGAPITTMNVPFQAKNSEYLLIMADAMIRGEETTGGTLSRPNLLRAVYRVMQESEKLNPTKGIDTVQFESAIKSGLQGRLDISQFAEMPGGEEAAYTYMMNSIFKEANDGNGNRIYKDYNTDTFVHEASYDDYCMQQEVPAHFKDHEQAHGSQIRMIIPSDLDIYKDYNGDKESEDNKVYYEWTEPDGTKKKVNANEFKREYEETIAANIAQSIDELATELRINSEDKKERNIALSKILQREILSSPRYGVDLIQACSIDKETGEFRIPKGDPIQAKRIEQLINSIIKNRVNKQKIPGGPIVQVSNFGTSRQLKIRFNARSGGLLKLESEFQPTDEYKTYDAYKKAEQAGIAYFEVFAPIWDNSLVEKFGNPDGSINIEAIEATDPELLKMVSYRIPTEDKYSCAPMKVVGFMPREAGEAIMLPYELTEIDDSDFDVDKRYVMRKDIRIVENRSAIEKLLIQKVSDSYASAHNGTVNKKFITDQVRMYMDNPEIMKTADRLMASIHREKEIIMKQYKDKVYKTIKPTSGKTYRDNKIVDMTLAVLTNEMTADKILNPGGFDGPKKMGYMVAAHKNPANANISWDKLKAMSIDELKDLSYTDKDLTWADTQVQFYRQNSAAASLIGVFAVNKVAHATLESNGIMIAVDELCGETPFTIAGTTFGGRMFIDSTLDSQGNLIGKTLGSLVSASADAVKDPVLNLMNINMTTAGMLNTMLRLGMSFNDAALFLSQDVIERVLNEFNKENLTNYETLSNIVQKKLDEIRKENNIEDDSTINKEELTEEELVKGLTSDEHTVIDYKVLLAFQKLKALTDAMKKPTFATRFNSISSAVGPLIVDNLMIEHKMEQFMDSNLENGTHFYTEDGVTVDIDDVFYDHPILKQFARTVDIAKNMFYDMPAGSIGFRNVLNTLPDGLADKFYNDKKLLDQLSNFYQSYLLLASRFIDENTLKNYVDGFPQWFMKQEYKEKYSDNALINAIRMGVSKKTNRAYLTINITGADAQAKEELSNAWIDLHKADPELSKRLFIYNFFRAGVGFSPKTFMSLVPTYVKERLNADYNGQKISYVDTYRNFPSVNPSIVIDQFIRNNWDNNKLVPKKDIKSLKYHVDLKKGILTVTNQFGNGDTANLDGVFYMKTRINGQTYLWRLLSNDERSMVYTRVMPLGSNGEYIEMSLSNIVTSLTNTTQTVEDMDSKDTSDIKEDAPAETDASEDTAKTPISNTETVKNLAWFADGIMKQRESIGKPVNKTEAENMLEKMKNNPSLFGEYFTRVFSQLGITLNKEDAVKEFKKLC